MNEPKTYSIKSFADLCNTLTIENKERLLTDVYLAFDRYITVVSELKKQNPELAGLQNSDIIEYSFEWVDDGGHNILGTRIESDFGSITIDPKQ